MGSIVVSQTYFRFQDRWKLGCRGATGDALGYLGQAITASDECVKQYMEEKGVSTLKVDLDLVDEQANLCIIKGDHEC